MTNENSPSSELNTNNLNALSNLKAYLSTEEELVFMQLLFSSSASIVGQNFGLKRQEVEKALRIQGDEAFFSYIQRVNSAVSRYFKMIYDEKRDRIIIMARVPAKEAKTTLNKEALAILLYIFYQQEVLNHDFTLLEQLLTDFGHEVFNASSKMKKNLDQLKRIGAIELYQMNTTEEAYKLTIIGVNLFSDSFLRRTAEFAQETQLNKEEVLKFFKRYNLYIREDAL